MSHRQILEALSGLLLALFVAMLSATVVSNALPQIIGALKGTQSQYTWVVTASLLVTTASTPIWGKLADLFSKKVLVQVAIVIFVAGSMICGLAQNTPQLIAALDKVSSALDTTKLIALNKAVDVDRKSSKAAAQDFATQNSLTTGIEKGPGGKITVGAANFSENATLGELYAIALTAAGYMVKVQQIGNRALYERHGFRAHGHIPLPDGPRLWRMWRDPV